MARVLLADDHRLFTDLVEVILRSDGHDVLGSASTAAAAISRVAAQRPALCLVEPTALAPSDPLGLVTALSRGGATRVVVLTGEPESVGAVAAMAAGAVGGVSKAASSVMLLAVLQRVVAGETVWALDDGSPPRPADSGSPFEKFGRLGPRERECLQHLTAGRSTTEIAAAMGVSPATVRSHVRSVLGKLEVHSRLAAASFAIRYGITGTAPVRIERIRTREAVATG